ncbi:uncharacterized mitochondrial protein-like protein, partial [Tanacetum coccineum]
MQDCKASSTNIFSTDSTPAKAKHTPSFNTSQHTIQDTESLDTCRSAFGKKVIGIKWVYRNKKDERGVVVRNKARLVAQGHRQEEEILKKFDFANVKTASTPIETQKPLVKDEEASDVDVHLYRSMIGSLMYLTASRPDIMFAVYACSRFQVTPKSSHLSVVKRIFRYLKGKPKLGLWYPRVSSFDLESYSDSDYARANLDRKSTTGGCQFLGRRLISWQCKKQTIVATSTTEAEYVAAASCWKVTPLFASILVQPTEDEGAPSERPSEAQPTPSPIPTSEVPLVPQTDPSPTHTSEVPVEPQTDPSPRPSPSTTIPDSIPESSGGNLGGHSSSDKSLSGNEGEMTLQSAQVSDQAKEIQHLKAQIKKLKKPAKPVIKHHKAWMQSISLKQRLARKRSSKKQWVHKESVSKQGRKFAKGEPSVHRDPLFDDIPEDTLDHIETENAQDVGRTRDIVGEEKENDENILSTKDVLSTDKEKVSTDKEKVSTDRPIVSTDGSKVSTERQIEGTDEQIKGTDEQRKGTDDHTEEGNVTQTRQPPPTSTIFGDDETIAKVLLNMSQAKAVSR